MHPKYRYRRKSSFTLIEVLLALTLTTLVLGVTGRIAVQTINTRCSIERELNHNERNRFLFDRMRDDLDALLFGMPGESSPVSITGSPKQILQLSVLSSVPVENLSLHTTLKPCRVRYQLERFDEGDGLVREVLDRTALGEVATKELVAIGITSFDVDLLCKNQWVRSIEANDPKAPEIQAIRVQIGWTGDGAQYTRTFRVKNGT